MRRVVHGSLRWEIPALLVIAALALWSAWPPSSSPLRYPDSRAYVQWPMAQEVVGVEVSRGRGPGYPLVLRCAGTGTVLVHVQTWLSVASFGLLGWVLARVPGVLLGVLLALCPAIRLWNQAILTESLSLSLLALLVALGLLIHRRYSRARFVAWSLCVCLFGFTRDANLLLLPFFWLPVLWHGLRRSLPALLLVVAVFIAGTLDAQSQGRWRVPTRIALFNRVAPDAEARAYFEAAGMPRSGVSVEQDARTDESAANASFSRWFDAHAQSTYLRWVLSRPASYLEVWNRLVKEDESQLFKGRYFKRLAQLPEPVVTPASEFLFRIAALPQPLWAALFLLPILDWVLNRRLGFLSLWSSALILATFLQAFATYHADASGVARHMLGASILYRLTFFLALYALYDIAHRARRGGATDC
jgi:hypothetical protein